MASTDTRTAAEQRRLSPTRASTSTSSRLTVGLAVIVAIGAVVLGTTPAARFTSWREAVVVVSTVAVGACLWQLRPTSLPGVRAGLASPELFAAIAVAVAYAWSLADYVSSGSLFDLGTSAVVAAVVLITRQVAREADGVRWAMPRWFVPAAIGVALACVLIWLAVDARPTRALAAGVAVTVAACPAAVGLALTSAYRFGTRRGDELGIVIHGRTVLEMSREVDTLVLGSIRPLIDGKRVSSVDSFVPDHERNLRWFAGALEHASDHEVGRAIAKLSARGRLTGVETHPGLGISGSVDRHPVRVGRPSWLGIDETDGVGTTVGVEVDSRPLGTITVVDFVRPETKGAVETLRHLGIDPVLVTDENALNAEHAAHQAGIDRVVADASATTTADLVAALKAEGRSVAVLDAQRTSSAPASIMMGATANDAPRAEPDVELSVGDVAQAATAVELARAIDHHTRIGQQVALAGGGIAAILAMSGVLTPMGGALVLAATSLVVLAWNGRLRRFAR